MVSSRASILDFGFDGSSSSSSVRRKLTIALVVVLLVSISLVAWAASYRYGRGTSTLVFEPGGNYTCPVTNQDVQVRYNVDGNTLWDSRGTVLMYGTFRDTQNGTPHYHEHNYMGEIDFDTSARQWDTGHQTMTVVAANPNGLSYYAPMVMTVWCL